MAKIKKIDDFDKNQKLFTLQQIIDLLPNKKEAEKYAFSAFGYAEDEIDASFINGQETGFITGTEWIKDELTRKLKEK